MSRLTKSWLLLPLLGISQLTLCSQAVAGGLWAQEFGDPAMGRANAGAAAGTDDASTALHNPAYMSETKKEQLMVSGGVIVTENEFSLDSVDESSRRGQQACSGGIETCDAGGKEYGLLGGASMFYTTPIDEKWAWGLSFSAASGGITDRDDDWVGRFDMTDVDLAVVALASSISYKVNDWLSVGVSAEFMYGFINLELKLPSIEPGTVPALPDGYGESSVELEDTTTEVSYSLSATVKVSEQTRIGFRYHPEVTLEFDDIDLEQPKAINPNSVITADLTYGQFVRIGITHELNDNLTVHSTLGWDDWSALKDVPLTIAGNTANIAQDWEDTYHVAFGVDYKLNSEWMLQTGFSYDSSPQDDDMRYAQLALDEQKRFAIGAQYNYGQPFSVGTQLVILDAGSAPIEREGLYYSGDFKTNRATLFMMNANWQF